MVCFVLIDVLMSFVQVIDDFIYKSCPVIAAGVTVGIIFWAASSYGAFTIMQVCAIMLGCIEVETTKIINKYVYSHIKYLRRKEFVY